MTDWQMKKLGEVLRLEYGKPLPKSNRVSSGKYPVYGANGIKSWSDSFYFDRKTIIVGRKGSAGEINLTEEKFWPLDVTYFVTFDDLKYDLKFIFHLLTTLELTRLAKGVKPGINRNDVYSIDIKIPHLHEQLRIVKILDEVFKKIAQAKEKAEKNLQNAKELFESYLQNIFSNPGNDWGDIKLGEICHLITKGSSPKWQGVKYVEKPGILFVTSENVGEGQLILKSKKYVEEKFNKKDKKSILQTGDVLTNIVGASIGRTAIYTLDDVANINQAVCILRCKPELISNIYLMNLLNSPFLKKILHSNEVNSARANLSLGFFSNLIIPLPSLSEQKAIVAKLDALSAETKKLEAIYKQKLVALEELKKSVLKRAFSGEL